MLKLLITAVFTLFLAAQAYAIEWRKVDIPGSAPIYSFYQSGDDVYIGFIGIRKSNDAGQTFSYANKYVMQDTTINLGSYMQSIYDIYRAENGTLYAVSSELPIIVSTDDGATWRGNSQNMFRYKHCFYEAGNTVFAFGFDNLLKTRNNGNSWDEVITNIKTISKNATVINNESIVFYAKHNATQEEYLQIYNTTTEQLSQKSISISPEYLYTNAGNLYALADKVVYKSTDMGDSWTTQCNLHELLLSQVYTDKAYVSLLSFTANENIIVANVLPANSGEGERNPSIAISFDSGASWELADISDASIYAHDFIKILNEEIYIHGLGIFVYDREAKKFSDTGYNFPVAMHYREFIDYSFCNLISNQNNNNWELKDYSGWQKVKDKSAIYYTFNQDKVILAEKTLKYIVDDNEIYKRENMFEFEVKRQTDDYIFLSTQDTNYNTRHEVIYNDGTAYSIEDVHTVDFDNNKFCYAGYEDGEFIIILSDKNNPKNADTIRPEGLDDVGYITNISIDKNRIMVEQNRKIYTSTDKGENWATAFDNSEANTYTMPKCHNDYFYVSGTFGLLRSEDGVVWENLLEGICEGFVLNFEFAPDGRIYAYTSEGVYISKKPNTISESSSKINSSDFTIYPNPSSERINIDFKGNIDLVEIYDLSGKMVLSSKSKEIDVSDLKPGTYFLKVLSYKCLFVSIHISR